MKTFIVPATLTIGLILASIFWFPKDGTAPKLAPSPTLALDSSKSSIVESPSPVAKSPDSRTKAQPVRIYDTQVEDIGPEVLTGEELASMDAIDRELNAVRERWADERQKIYQRLNVTPEEEKQLAEAADAYEGEFQTKTEAGESTEKSPNQNEINLELADAAKRFDHRTVEILGVDRFRSLVEERDKFNARLRAEGIGSNIGSFW